MIFAIDELVPGSVTEATPESSDCKALTALSQRYKNCGVRSIIRDVFPSILDKYTPIRIIPRDGVDYSRSYIFQKTETENYTCFSMKKRALEYFIETEDGKKYFAEDSLVMFKTFASRYGNNQDILICLAKTEVKAGMIKCICKKKSDGMHVPIMHEDHADNEYEMDQQIIVDDSLSTERSLSECYRDYTDLHEIPFSVELLGCLFDNEISSGSDENTQEYYFLDDIRVFNKDDIIQDRNEIINKLFSAFTNPPDIVLPIEGKLSGSFITRWSSCESEVMNKRFNITQLEITSSVNKDVKH
jgi:histidinol phosphatase-like enzyme